MNIDEMRLPDAIEPSCWYVAFHEKGHGRFVSALAFGRFKHVSAFGYYPGFKGWLYVDPQFGRLRLLMISHEQHKLVLNEIEGATLVRFEVGERAFRASLPSRLFLYCVPVIKYLIGLSCVAITPCGLYRQLLKSGGIEIDASEPKVSQEQNKLRPA